MRTSRSWPLLDVLVAMGIVAGIAVLGVIAYMVWSTPSSTQPISAAGSTPPGRTLTPTQQPAVQPSPAPTTAITTTGAPGGFTSYTALDSTFSIAVPQDWTAQFGNTDDKLFQASSPANQTVGLFGCTVKIQRHVLSGDTLDYWVAKVKTSIETNTLVPGLTGVIFQISMVNRPGIALRVGRIVDYYVDASDGSGDVWDIGCSQPLGSDPGDPLLDQIAQTFAVGPNPPPSPRQTFIPYRVGDWISFKTSIFVPGSTNLQTVDGGRFRIVKIQRTTGDSVGLAAQVDIEYSSGLATNGLFTCAFDETDLTAVDDSGGVYYLSSYYGNQLPGTQLTDGCDDPSVGKKQGWLWFYGFPTAKQLAYLDFNPVLGSDSHITAP